MFARGQGAGRPVPFGGKVSRLVRPDPPLWGRKDAPMARAAYQPIPRYPASLEAHVAEADRLARAIGILAQKAAPEHPAFLWLRGRADEIRAMVQEIVREWSSDGLETSLACDAIGGYVGAI